MIFTCICYNLFCGTIYKNALSRKCWHFRLTGILLRVVLIIHQCKIFIVIWCLTNTVECAAFCINFDVKRCCFCIGNSLKSLSTIMWLQNCCSQVFKKLGCITVQSSTPIFSLNRRDTILKLIIMMLVCVSCEGYCWFLMYWLKTCLFFLFLCFCWIWNGERPCSL